MPLQNLVGLDSSIHLIMEFFLQSLLLLQSTSELMVLAYPFCLF